MPLLAPTGSSRVALAAPAKAPKPAAPAKVTRPAPTRTASKTPAKGGKRKQRIVEAKQLLAAASKSSKNPAVRKGISKSITLLAKKDYQAASARVGELKRTAALNGDSQQPS